jgi:hypothetical protein
LARKLFLPEAAQNCWTSLIDRGPCARATGTSRNPPPVGESLRPYISLMGIEWQKFAPSQEIFVVADCKSRAHGVGAKPPLPVLVHNDSTKSSASPQKFLPVVIGCPPSACLSEANAALKYPNAQRVGKNDRVGIKKLSPWKNLHTGNVPAHCAASAGRSPLLRQTFRVPLIELDRSIAMTLPSWVAHPPSRPTLKSHPQGWVVNGMVKGAFFASPSGAESRRRFSALFSPSGGGNRLRRSRSFLSPGASAPADFGGCAAIIARRAGIPPCFHDTDDCQCDLGHQRCLVRLVIPNPDRVVRAGAVLRVQLP